MTTCMEKATHQWEPVVRFTVHGLPGPQGSKRGFANKKTGAVMMVESSKKVKPWRSSVAGEAVAARLQLKPDVRDLLFDGTLAVSFTFLFSRPKSHYRTGKNAGVLRPDAPYYVTSKAAGDVDKLQRSTFDALTGILYRDDSQIAGIMGPSFKVYCNQGELPGMVIQVLLWAPKSLNHIREVIL